MNASSTPVFGLFGIGGFAREVMPIALQNLSIDSRRIYFVETRPSATQVNGIPVISEDAFLGLECNERFFNIAIADWRARARIANTCIQHGAKPLSLFAPQSIIYSDNDIGEGIILSAYAMITSNAKIGRFFHSNLYSYIAHDCVIGDFVTFAPRVSCNGVVHIHNFAYIGTTAMIRQGTTSRPLVIGEGAIVGMGAVVTKDVPPYTTVVGNPARPLRVSSPAK